MNRNWPAYRLACLLLATLAWMGSLGQAAPGPSARVVRVDAVVDGHAVRIQARASGPFEYTTYRPSTNLFVADLAQVSSATPGGARVLKSELVSSYRVLQYRAGEKAMVRLEVLMRKPVEPRVEREGPDQLTLIFEAPAAARSGQENPTRPVSAGAGATAIERVEVTQSGQQAQVHVEGNGRLSYEVQRLRRPDRLALDFSGVRVRVPQKSIASNLQPVRGVRVGQFKPNVTRVVIDLEKEVSYSVSADGRSVTVAFGSSGGGEQPRAARVEEKEKQESAARPAQAVERPAENGGESSGERMSLPGTLTQPAAALARPAETKPGPAASEPAQPAPARPVEAQAAAAAPAAQEAQKFAGEPISVNFKDVDLKDFFRLIHEISGLNVVVDPNVKGTLTIAMSDVPWDQVLDIVLRNNSLDKQLEGNVLRISTRDTLKKEAEIRRDLVKAQAEAEPQVTHLVVLSYAKASGLRDTLKRFLSSRGEILADERSNTLIIRDIPSVLPEIDNLIKQLDRKGQQVEIEARVVAANRDFSREIGTQFGFATTSTGGRTVFGGLQGFKSPVERPFLVGSPLRPPLLTSGTTSIPLNTNLGAVAPTSGATFVHSSPNLSLDFIISAAESRGVAKLLSKPKVITSNNEKAVIKQGTKIPIQTTVNQTVSVQFIDALLKLEVTPQITAEGTIFMDIVVENAAPDFSRVVGTTNIPAIDVQSADTHVLVSDGGTVVMGGVIITEQRTNIVQVPLFGSIPLIGHLFKRTTVSTSSKELLFFVTPRIVPS